MTKTIEIKHTEDSIKQLIGLYEHFKQNGDVERGEKALKLIKKLDNKEFIIAFCGHFSAGKSTMINALLGENVLPSSPIPTSANLVKVHNADDDFAKVYYRDEPPLLFQAPYDFKKVKEYCKSGAVQEIEIGQSHSELAEGVTVMDTPGVDSTDDAHRISTESAIHLADIVFYVMDYNHVQSELNFMYTKELLRNGVELYLIINQIDKHNNEELSFSDFQTTVKDSFATWDVHPNGIFYTSLKKPEDPNNQFNEIKALIQKALNQKEVRLEASTRSSINILVQEHFKWLKMQEEEKAPAFETIINQYPEEKRSTVLQDDEKLTEQIEELEDLPEKWSRLFDADLEKILKSAYLMPFQTRELAQSYLASVQPDFKVGLLFGKKKTEAERKERLELFYNNLKTQVDSQINWHIRQFASNVLKEADILDDELQGLAQGLTVELDDTLIKDSVKPGAGLTGESVLNYCDQIVAQIQKEAKRICSDYKYKVMKIKEQQNEKQLILLKDEWQKVKEVSEALRNLEKLEIERQQKEDQLFNPISNTKEIYQFIQEQWSNEEKNIRIYTNEAEFIVSPVMTKEVNSENQIKETDDTPVSIEKTIAKLTKAVSLLKNKKGFQRLTEVLSSKAEKLQNREFTIALFGAFSAGKSSFANALLGEKVLPVSPNPTTAAINRICPPNKEYKHGTAVVHLKSETQMLEDVQKSLKFFGIHCEHLREAEKYISTMNPQSEGDGKEKVHLSFLKAFQKGFPIYQEKLGSNIKTDIQEFRGFVANEFQSCFVESIDLYFESELTKKGITLVDTPGADSINARHTGVAFEYIKNSDAILFVTYYNHAFSKADREFLIQLGRVKDAFELDKMFFIINAIDLADSEDELEEVQSYVHDQLIQYGIRFPRIFGVSSLLALTDKKSESKINHFKQEFEHFLNHDLAKMTVQSAESEFQKGIQLLEGFIATAQEGKEKKQVKKQALLEQQEQITSILNDSSSQLIKDKLSQEQKELLFYVKQRVFLRFTDFFKEAFNPAIIQKGNKEALNIALEELLQSLGYDFSQEMRATTLRLENIVKYSFEVRFDKIVEQISSIQQDVRLTSFELNRIKTPEFPIAFENISRDTLNKTFRHFKNAKAFFEKNEKQLMQNELEELLRPMADDYLNIQGEVIKTDFSIFIEEEYKQMIGEIKADLTEQFNGWLDILDEHIDVKEWLDVRNQLIMK
ncbi:dynamin family protein [Heyndrickxia sp. NPDC080065]|uniref:dynamin family protein n=1 Tax=Heyndrickxia sp. NPDC080065 TaxID=3390568 RepID=UPI003D0693C4